MRVPAKSAARKTPTATPSPAHTPIQYQDPTCKQWSLTGRSAGDIRGAAPRSSYLEEGTELSDDKPLLVFFTSERSGPARRMESLLAHLARKERTRVRIMRVEVEEQPELAEKFRVEAVPTLVLVMRKQVVDRIDGRVSAPKIEAMLARHVAAPAAAA
jgi:thioredoxin 1